KKNLYLTIYNLPEPVRRYPFLLHTIAVPDCDGVVFFGLVINRHTKWRTQRIHPAITFTYSIFFFIEAAEMWLAIFHDFFRYIRQTIFFYQWENGQFNRCQFCR